MELGRSCVLKPYRNKRTLELLWQGVWSYVREHGADVDDRLRELRAAPILRRMPRRLSFLYHNALAPEDWRVKAHEHLRVDMNMMPPDAVNARRAQGAAALDQGLSQVGAYIGDGAVIDHQFGTTDVFIIMPVEAINSATSPISARLTSSPPRSAGVRALN